MEEWNKEIEAKYSAGDLLPEATLAALEPEPKKIMQPTDAWVRWWRAAFGWSMLTRSDNEGSWLPYGHADMEAARRGVAELFSVKKVHPFLCLNVDQLWRNAWCLRGHKLCFKDRAAAGVRAKRTKVGPRQDKKVHSVKGARSSITATRRMEWYRLCR